MRGGRTDPASVAMWGLLGSSMAATLTSWLVPAWAALLPVTLLLMTAVYWSFAGLRDGAPPGTAPWLLAGVPALGLLQLATGLSHYNNATLLGIVYWSALVAAFTVAASVCEDPGRRHRFLTGFGVLASVLGWVALVQPYAGRLGIPFLRSVAPDAYAGTFANRNMYACFAELAFPVLVWLGLRNGRQRWHWLVNAGVLACSVLTSGSRAGALLVFAECILLAVVFTRGQRLYWKFAFGGVAALLLLTAVTGDSNLPVRIQFNDPLVFRRQIYESGLNMLAERPLTGFGLGAFSAAYPAYALFDNGRFVNLAHNDWLQIAVECGLPGLALLVTFALVVLSTLGRSRWAYGIPVVMLHAMIDFPLHRIGVAAWFMALGGALWAARMGRGRNGSRRPKRVKIAGLRLPSRADLPTPAPSPVDVSDRSSATAGR